MTLKTPKIAHPVILKWAPSGLLAQTLLWFAPIMWDDDKCHSGVTRVAVYRAITLFFGFYFGKSS